MDDGLQELQPEKVGSLVKGIKQEGFPGQFVELFTFLQVADDLFPVKTSDPFNFFINGFWLLLGFDHGAVFPEVFAGGFYGLVMEVVLRILTAQAKELGG